MRPGMSLAILAGVSVLVPSVQSQQPLLQLQGLPWSGGDMTLHVTAPSDVGDLVWLGVGLDPLPLEAPLPTNKGPWYIGQLLTSLLIGVVPTQGRLDMAFAVPPPVPGAEGIAIALQAYVPPALSNPATLNLDEPYLLPASAVAIDHPMPSQGASFGDKVAVGDFNADGIEDLAVGAWLETVGGVVKAGRVYVLWGPSFDSFLPLASPSAKFAGSFGGGLAVQDVDGDQVDDLIVAEAAGGDPPTPGAHGALYVFRGGSLTDPPWLTIPSFGTGLEAQVFGRILETGDLDGDGGVDIVVGTPDASVQGLSKAGRLEVYRGPSYGPPTLIGNPEPKANDYFGSGVALGDVTGDGVADIFEASGRAAYAGVFEAGVAHVFDGPTLALLQTLTAPVPTAAEAFGQGLQAADLDADGLAEMIVADATTNFFVAWDPLEPSTTDKWPKPLSPNPGFDTSFGYFTSAADMNEDALIDIVIADPFEGDLAGCPAAEEGSVYVALAPYFSTYLRLTSPFPHCADQFSWSLVTADLDGDGTQEIVSGATNTDIGGVQNAGRAILSFP